MHPAPHYQYSGKLLPSFYSLKRYSRSLVVQRSRHCMSTWVHYEFLHKSQGGLIIQHTFQGHITHLWITNGWFRRSRRESTRTCSWSTSLIKSKRKSNILKSHHKNNFDSFTIISKNWLCICSLGNFCKPQLFEMFLKQNWKKRWSMLGS